MPWMPCRARVLSLPISPVSKTTDDAGSLTFTCIEAIRQFRKATCLGQGIQNLPESKGQTHSETDIDLNRQRPGLGLDLTWRSICAACRHRDSRRSREGWTWSAKSWVCTFHRRRSSCQWKKAEPLTRINGCGHKHTGTDPESAHSVEFNHTQID